MQKKSKSGMMTASKKTLIRNPLEKLSKPWTELMNYVSFVQ